MRTREQTFPSFVSFGRVQSANHSDRQPIKIFPQSRRCPRAANYSEDRFGENARPERRKESPILLRSFFPQLAEGSNACPENGRTTTKQAATAPSVFCCRCAAPRRAAPSPVRNHALQGKRTVSFLPPRLPIVRSGTEGFFIPKTFST